MAIVNLQGLIPKTPEEELLEGVPGLNISPLPSGIDLTPPPPDVPRFRGYGDFLAQRGGFAPEDLRTREELMGMTQAEVDEYQRQRKQARRAGIGETLLRVGQAFQGKDASALAMQREQARREMEQQTQLNTAIDQLNIPEAQKSLLKLLPPEQQYEAIYPSAQQDPSSYREYLRTDSTPTEAEFRNFLFDKEKAGGTVIQMGKEEEEYVKSLAKLGQSDIEETRKIATTSRELLPRLQSAQILLQSPDFKTGPLTEKFLPLKKLYNDITGQDQQEVSQQELFQALANYTVPRMRPPGSGATSDFEANLFASATIGLGNTKESNELLVATMIQQAEREQVLLRLKEEYFLKNKGNTVGFDSYLLENNLVPPLYQQINLNKQDIGDLYDSGQIKNGEAYVDMTDPLNPRLTIFRLSDFE